MGRVGMPLRLDGVVCCCAWLVLKPNAFGFFLTGGGEQGHRRSAEECSDSVYVQNWLYARGVSRVRPSCTGPLALGPPVQFRIMKTQTA